MFIQKSETHITGRRVASIAEDPDLEVFQDFDVQDPEEAPLKRRPWAAALDEHEDARRGSDVLTSRVAERAVPAHAERQAVPRAVAEPPAAAAAQGRVVGRRGHRDLDARAGDGHQVGATWSCTCPTASQRHQEPVELDHPQVARAGRPRVDRRLATLATSSADAHARTAPRWQRGRRRRVPRGRRARGRWPRATSARLLARLEAHGQSARRCSCCRWRRRRGARFSTSN